MNNFVDNTAETVEASGSLTSDNNDSTRACLDDRCLSKEHYSKGNQSNAASSIEPQHEHRFKANRQRYSGGESCIEETKKDSPIKRVFFRGVEKRTELAVVKALFSRFGEIEFFKMPFSQKRSKNMGHGIVIYRFPASVQSVISNQTLLLGDRIIEVSQFDSKKKQIARVKNSHAMKSKICAERKQTQVPRSPSKPPIGDRLGSSSSCQQSGIFVAAADLLENQTTLTPKAQKVPKLQMKVHQFKPTKKQFFRTNRRPQEAFGQDNLVFHRAFARPSLK